MANTDIPKRQKRQLVKESSGIYDFAHFNDACLVHKLTPRRLLVMSVLLSVKKGGFTTTELLSHEDLREHFDSLAKLRPALIFLTDNSWIERRAITTEDGKAMFEYYPAQKANLFFALYFSTARSGKQS